VCRGRCCYKGSHWTSLSLRWTFWLGVSVGRIWMRIRTVRQLIDFLYSIAARTENRRIDSKSKESLILLLLLIVDVLCTI
jgi:hypothetical protein